MILETIQSDSAPHIFQSNVKYRLLRLVKHEFVMNDPLNQNIYLDADNVHLKAASLTDLQHEGKWAPWHSPLLGFLCFFQTFCFQSTNLPTSLALYTSSRIEWSTPLPPRIPGKDRMSPKSLSSTREQFPTWAHYMGQRAFWCTISLVLVDILNKTSPF